MQCRHGIVRVVVENEEDQRFQRRPFYRQTEEGNLIWGIFSRLFKGIEIGASRDADIQKIIQIPLMF